VLKGAGPQGIFRSGKASSAERERKERSSRLPPEKNTFFLGEGQETRMENKVREKKSNPFSEGHTWALSKKSPFKQKLDPVGKPETGGRIQKEEKKAGKA